MSALKKTTLEEWGEVYVGVRAQPAAPHIPVLFSSLTFFQWSLQYLNPTTICINHVVQLPTQFKQ